jgi:hypothetical protein
MAKKNYNGLFVMVLALVLIGEFVSCASFSVGQQTETSQMLLKGANEMLVNRDNGMLLDQFRAAFELKYPGTKFDSQYGLLTDPIDLTFTYEGRNYRLSMNCKSDDNTSGFVKYRYLSAKMCVDITK